jgi:hypothetical protein
MNFGSAKIFSAVLFGIAVAAGGAVPSAPAEAADGLAVGACVTVRGQPSPGRIIALSRGGYVVQGQGKAPSEAMNWATTDVDPGPCPAPPNAAQLAQPHACFASDSDSLGATVLEQGFRGAVRQTIERAPAPGYDGAVTVSFQSFKVGAGRRWTAADSFNFSADPGKPVYPLRVKFTSCTDYRTAIELRQQESNYECFTTPTGETVCQMSGNSGGMMQPTTQRIPK